jgi:hypothetical protein
MGPAEAADPGVAVASVEAGALRGMGKINTEKA